MLNRRELAFALLILGTVAVAPDAHAATCEWMALQIDRALRDPNTSEQTKRQLQALLDQSTRDAAGGGNCENALIQAMQILGIQIQ
jgi:hypothetical protein